MDETVTALLAELEALGIAAREDKGEVFLKPTPPEPLRARLRANKEAIAEALWAKAGRARQEAALVRLAADRRAWIERAKQRGVYRGKE